MLGSLDPSRRKICVTVFLDELFEELDDDEIPTSETDSGVKIEEEPPVDKVSTTTWEYETISENSCSNLRTRKVRKQSKFGKSSENYENDLSSIRRNYWGERSDQIERQSSLGVTSIPQNDTDMGGPIVKESESGSYIEKTEEKFTSRVLSECVMTDESFLSGSGSCIEKIDQEVDCSSTVLFSTKSTQFDASCLEIIDEVLLKTKEGKPGQDHLNLKQTGDNTKDNKLQIKPTLNNLKADICSENIPRDGDLLIVGRSSEQITNLSPQEVIRIWSTCKKVWSEGYESEMSEVDCITFTDETSAKQYTVLVETDVEPIIESERNKYVTHFLMTANSESAFQTFSRVKEDRKQLKSHQANNTKSANLETSVEDKNTQKKLDQFMIETTNKLFECRNKNFAEGDTFEAIQRYTLRLESKEKFLVCNKNSNSDREETKTKKQIENHTVADVFIKREAENSDAESEMVFAESPNDVEDTQIYTQVFELEDAVSATGCLRRMKTLEILADGSTNEINSMNTEVILFCENLSKDMSVEALERDCNNISGLKELFAKDSKDNSVYLIEIPLKFVKSNRNKQSMTCLSKSDLE